MSRRTRPAVATFVNDAVRFTAGIEEAVKAYAASKPWRGCRDEQVAKLQTLHEALCVLCETDCGFEAVPIEVPIKLAAYFPARGVLKVAGPISVTTYLYAFAGVIYGTHAASHNQRMAFAVNLFKRAFPVSFRNADLSGPTIVAG